MAFKKLYFLWIFLILCICMDFKIAHTKIKLSFHSIFHKVFKVPSIYVILWTQYVMVHYYCAFFLSSTNMVMLALFTMITLSGPEFLWNSRSDFDLNIFSFVISIFSIKDSMKYISLCFLRLFLWATGFFISLTKGWLYREEKKKKLWTSDLLWEASVRV